MNKLSTSGKMTFPGSHSQLVEVSSPSLAWTVPSKAEKIKTILYLFWLYLNMIFNKHKEEIGIDCD